MAYCELEPFGPNIADLRDARQCLHYLASHSKAGTPLRLEQFLLGDGGMKRRPKTDKEVIEYMISIWGA